jgi:hypothetical protein
VALRSSLNGVCIKEGAMGRTTTQMELVSITKVEDKKDYVIVIFKEAL